ncbi:hypothetical protein Tco_1326419 [Tanacetum coccineum]
MSTSNTHQQSLNDAGSETRPPMLERVPWMQKEDDLRGDDLKHYEADIEAMNLILISIPNGIYNSVYACKTVKSMWQRVERLMRGMVQNKIDRETRFNNEFDQFVAEPGEALMLTEDSYDDLFDYLQQFEKLVNASRANKVEESHDPLALVAHMGSFFRTTAPYYVTHPSSVIQSKNSGNDGRYTRRSYVQAEVIEGTNVKNDAGNIQRTLRTTSSGTAANCFMEQKLLTEQDEAGVILTDKQNDFLFADASRMEEIEELSANICLMARIQPTNFDSDEGPSYDFAFLSELQTPSTSYVNPLFAKDAQNKNLEQQRDKLELSVVELKRQTVELQKTQSILKRKISKIEDKYDDTVLDLEARAKKNADVVLKIDNNIQDEIEKIQRESIEIQEGMQKRINILENDVQRCQKQSLDFELQLQHEKERRKCESSLKSVCETSWISKIENLKREIIELIENVNQKTYAYTDVRAQNQDLLITIYKLKAKLKNVEKGKSVNTKFDKDIVSNNLLCVTPLNKKVFQKKTIAPKTEEKHVLSKTVTLQTSPNKQQAVETNKNVIAPGMYKVEKTQNTNTNKAKSILSYTGLRATSSVRRPSNRDSSFKNTILSNTKNSSEKVEVSDRSNKKSNGTSKNVDLNKNIVTNDDIKNALIAKNVLCVSCAKNVLIPCHDNCLAKYKLNVHSKVRRALFTTPRTVKSKFEDTTLVVLKTRFSVKTVQSKSLDITPVVSKTKIAAITPLSAKNKVVQIVPWIVDSGCSKHMIGDRSLLKIFVEKFMGTVRFGNDHFTAITGYGDYVQGNITVSHVYYVEGLRHNLFSVG